MTCPCCHTVAPADPLTGYDADDVCPSCADRDDICPDCDHVPCDCDTRCPDCRMPWRSKAEQESGRCVECEQDYYDLLRDEVA